MATSPYQLSFTAGGLLQQEASVLVGVYLRTGDWEVAAKKVRDQNLLQARTTSSATRISREARKRLATLSRVLLEAFQNGSSADQRQLLWIAACRRYQLLRDFGRDVIRERFLQLDLTVGYDDFDKFLESQAVWHAEIDELAKSTRAKLRQVAFRMLREAGILSENNLIQPVLISRELATLLQGGDPEEFLVFPLNEADVTRTLS